MSGPALQTESLLSPTVDISAEIFHHSIVAQGTPEIRQAHPSLALMPDGKTLVAVWTIGHGGVCGPASVSRDNAETWQRIAGIPEGWRENFNCPSLFVVPDPLSGGETLMAYATRGEFMTYAESRDGEHWSDFQPCPISESNTYLSHKGMPFTTVAPVQGGRALIGATNGICQSYSYDGGRSWLPWETVLEGVNGSVPCEPFIIRSPKGDQLLMLIRDNNHAYNSLFMTSNDEGATWSAPRRTPSGLTFDRHEARYLPDGRLLVLGRDRAGMSPAQWHLTAWIGRYEDIVKGRPGQYRIKLLHAYHGSVEYPGIEVMPDGTVVAMTSLSYSPGENYSVVCTRFHIEETDSLFRNKQYMPDRQTTMKEVDISSEASRLSVIYSGSGTSRPGYAAMASNLVLWERGKDGSPSMMKSSDDGFVSWSDLVPLPENWSLMEGPPSLYAIGDTLFSFARADGFLFVARSTDGAEWSEFEEAKTTEGGALESNYETPSSLIRYNDGRLLLFSAIRKPGDEGRFNRPGNVIYNSVIAMSESLDMGKTWSPWRIIFDPGVPYLPFHPCAVMSKEGNQLLLLCSDAYRSANSWYMTFEDGGEGWSEPRQTTNNLTLDGYNARYGLDGRLVITGRDYRTGSPTRYCTVAWVGRYDDILNGGDGAFRICLQRSYNGTADAYGIGFPGLERLDDGSFAVVNTIAPEGCGDFELVCTLFSLEENQISQCVGR